MKSLGDWPVKRAKEANGEIPSITKQMEILSRFEFYFQQLIKFAYSTSRGFQMM